jgi:hypothetical protein
MYRKTLIKGVLALAIISQAACNGPEGEMVFPLPENFDATTPYTVSISGTDLSQTVDNPFFPAPPGASWAYEGITEDGAEHIDVTVLSAADMNGSKTVMGLDARVIRDTVFLDGELAEDTWDWYGQDSAGNVWYIGEDTAEYENGMVVCNCGAWEWGLDGALPGFQMLANPLVGDAYRQEYYENEAEDIAEVIETNVTVTVTAGMFIGCIKTREMSVIDRSYEEFKTYCPGIGLVLEEADDERIELIYYSGLVPL